jgi:predicted transposase YbfD/YdcC
MHNDVMAMFELGLKKYPYDFATDTFTAPAEKKGGKIVTGTATVISPTGRALEWFKGHKECDSVKSVIRIGKLIEHCDDTKESTIETHYFISSIILSAEKMLEVSIKHWSVETIQGCLDRVKTYAEDSVKIKIGNAPEILSVFRKLSMNLTLGTAKKNKMSLPSVLRFMRENTEYLKQVLTEEPTLVPLIADVIGEWQNATNQKSCQKAA